MCGIAGVLYRDQSRMPQTSVLKQMGNSIAHRGPDGFGMHCAPGVGMVHRRLAIIDLQSGQQPISNEDDTIHVVFNGEIYNYRDLRDSLESKGHRFRTWSDTEVLVHLYEEYGTDMCQHLQGMFAFAIRDDRNRDLFLARDHLGQKPLFIHQDDEKLVFGSELKAVLACPGLDRSISPVAIEDYLTFGFVPGAQSILKSVSKLPAAHHLHIRQGEWRTDPHRYWQLQYASDATGDVNEWAERIDEAIRSSVRAHLVSDVPIGAFLSGGLDSGAIVAAASELVATPLKTFSIGFREEKFSELPAAAAVASHFGCEHTSQIVTPDAIRDLDDLTFLYDEPFADASAIPTLAVSRLAAKHVKVALSGDGGDELFAGYWRYQHDLREQKLREMLPVWFRQTILKRLAGAWPRTDWLPRPLRLQSFLQNMSAPPATAYAQTVSSCRVELRRRLLTTDVTAALHGHRPESVLESYFRQGGTQPLNQMLSADVNTLLPDDFLTKVDRASMGFGLEVRPPFVDRSLMELAAAMPVSFKLRQGTSKWMLKHLFQSRLPERHAHRRKQGFEIPIDAWLRGPLREQVHDVLLSESSPLSQYVQTKKVRALYRGHCRRSGRHGQLLWSLLVLARWLTHWQATDAPRELASPHRITRPSAMPLEVPA